MIVSQVQQFHDSREDDTIHNLDCSALACQRQQQYNDCIFVIYELIHNSAVKTTEKERVIQPFYSLHVTKMCVCERKSERHIQSI